MSIQGKTVLVTGSTDGLGKEVAKRLAGMGARVLLHGRDAAKLDAARREIAAAAPGADLETYRADLASLEETRELAQQVLARHPKLDVLVNNAGVALFGARAGRQQSRDGHELHFAVNYLAPFLLTLLLLPALKAAAPSRIVNVASIGQAPIDFDDPMIEQGYSGERGYSQSKLAQIGFTYELAERLKGSGVAVTALHPATFMDTPMVVGAGFQARSSVHDGAEATVRLIASDDVEGETGVFYNQTARGQPHAQAEDPAARRRLWDLSMQLTRAPSPD